MLEKYFDDNILKEVLRKDNTLNIPTAADRRIWTDIADKTKQYFIGEAESFLGKQWEVFKATDYLDFARTGSRQKGEITKLRRRALGFMSIAECIENKGRFIDDIINCIWMICEESTWVPPCHNLPRAGKIVGSVPALLPDVADPLIDIESGETAAMLTVVYYILKEKIDEVSPIICERIEYEVRKRILEPFLSRNDMWWMGVYTEGKLGNWTVWCISNCLTVFAVFEKDFERKVQAFKKSLIALNKYVKYYLPDGGCDEGPAYWCQSTGTFYECMELIKYVTDNNINIYNEQIIKNMVSFIYKTHINDNFCCNFADSGPYLTVSPDLLYRMGKSTNDNNLVMMAVKENERLGDKIVFNSWFPMMKVLNAAFYKKTIDDEKTEGRYPFLNEVYLPNIQIMSAREKGGTNDGLFLCVKGGHNDEPHNHNDVGNFLIYRNGLPLIIDTGNAEYRKETFNEMRYTLWQMQSGYHNIPMINGYMQHEGPKFAAKNSNAVFENDVSRFSTDLTDTYERCANIKSYNRSIALIRTPKSCIELTEDIILKNKTDNIQFNLMTCCECKLSNDRILLSGDKGQSLEITFDNDKLKCDLEPIKLSGMMENNWGSTIIRITFRLKTSTDRISTKFIFK